MWTGTISSPHFVGAHLNRLESQMRTARFDVLILARVLRWWHGSDLRLTRSASIIQRCCDH
jgi:hypothetical protein